MDMFKCLIRPHLHENWTGPYLVGRCLLASISSTRQNKRSNATIIENASCVSVLSLSLVVGVWFRLRLQSSDELLMLLRKKPRIRYSLALDDGLLRLCPKLGFKLYVTRTDWSECVALNRTICGIFCQISIEELDQLTFRGRDDSAMW